jgi:hypothetical protein
MDISFQAMKTFDRSAGWHAVGCWRTDRYGTTCHGCQTHFGGGTMYAQLHGRAFLQDDTPMLCASCWHWYMAHWTEKPRYPDHVNVTPGNTPPLSEIAEATG